ncbi:MAG TPA: pseudouridine-5'-phosphate glycosidase [Kofleriaceae bacterium]|jgi:pseudouridine-5'-phosphate glycosidase
MKLEIAHDVEAARGGAIVALESTLVAHGLPYPDNLAVAKELEETVRNAGAVPATIAVFEGVPHVGLTAEQLEQIAKDGAKFIKAGATDLAIHAARKTNAATTVSATAAIAARAGIRVFATGGIGGVHRGDSGDVSYDLSALARTPIAIISAGAKAILDLPRTLERLETLGVLVIGYQTDEFPAFYTRGSGLKLDYSVETAKDLAEIAKEHWLAGGAGILVANPIPADAAMEKKVIDQAIDAALSEASAEKIGGKKLTPFLLDKLAKATGGASVKANRALAVNNAKVAGELAVALQASERRVGFALR